jgi:poly-beta-1,6-N-acetyl-D-glucosamine biosynthesis protein PgaD
MKTHSDKKVEDIFDENGQSYPECLIIDKPDLKSMPLIFGEGLLTVLFWGAWFYLWLPIVSMLAWWLGFKFFYRHMVELGGFGGFIQFLDVFFYGVLFLCGALAAWSFYNFKRYGSYNRRNHVLKTDIDKMAEFLNISIQKLQKAQLAKHVSFSFDDDNTVQNVGFS